VLLKLILPQLTDLGQLILPGENIDHGVSSLLRFSLAPLENFRSVIQEDSAKEPVWTRKLDRLNDVRKTSRTIKKIDIMQLHFLLLLF
jgi:hypothetical protein